MTPSPLLDTAIAEFTRPIEEFLETGLFVAPIWTPDSIPFSQVRRFARAVAKEQKRPFIEVDIQYKGHRWISARQPIDRSDEVWHAGIITIPKLRYLQLLHTPLRLAASNPSGAPIVRLTKSFNSAFERYAVRDKPLWDEYLHALRTRPEMRAALRLPPLE